MVSGLASMAAAGARTRRRAMSLDGKTAFTVTTGAPFNSVFDEGTDTPTITDIPTFEQSLDSTLPAATDCDDQNADVRLAPVDVKGVALNEIVEGSGRYVLVRAGNACGVGPPVLLDPRLGNRSAQRQRGGLPALGA